MANTSDEKWYFTKERLENTPSRQCGIEAYKELSYRQQAANFIQDMGQRLKVSQLCINTAIVYMHRFYVFHSFTHFPWASIASASIFLAAKVEEQPFEGDKKMNLFPEPKDPHHRPHHENKPGPAEDPHKHRSSRPHESSSSNQQQIDREYREKREAERMARHSSKPALPNAPNKQPLPHGHHRPPVDSKLKQHNRPPSSGHPPSSRPDPHRDILREATRDIGLKDHREQINRESRDSTDLSRDINTINKDITNSGSINRDLQQVRNNEKDMQKRDYLLKPNVSSDTNNYSADKRCDPSKSRVSVHPSNKIPPKHESMHRHEENKSYLPKNGSELKKQHMSSSAFLNKSVNSASHKMNSSPFTSDTSKSVQKQNSSLLIKEQPNGSNNNSSFNLSLCEDKIKVEMKEDVPLLGVKKPSLFSPEKSPPKRLKTPPGASRRSMEVSTIPSTSQIPSTISPFSSPDGGNEKRNRTISSSSEPELRPVMKKIDQIEGFENLLRDSSIGIKVHHKVPDIITPIADIKEEKIVNQVKEFKPPDLIPPFTGSSNILSQPIVNGIETNPTLISNLLKETPNMLHLNAITSPVNKDGVKEIKEKEHHHKERKKKSKEKHKHKDKDRNRDDKEKKKKHKDKDREKHKSKDKNNVLPTVTQPIKITISKDKIQPPESPVVSTGLKIKIPKDRLKAETIGESSQVPPTGGLKIKIPKDVINNFASENKKRDRDKNSPTETPPAKISKSSYIRTSDSKQNGRSSYHKVTQQGDGETSMHRLAESKYINKGAST